MLAYHCSAQSCPTCFHPTLKESGSHLSDHCLPKANQTTLTDSFYSQPNTEVREIFRQILVKAPNLAFSALLHNRVHCAGIESGSGTWPGIYFSSRQQVDNKGQTSHSDTHKNKAMTFYHQPVAHLPYFFGRSSVQDLLQTAEMHAWLWVSTSITHCLSWPIHTHLLAAFSQMVNWVTTATVLARTTPNCAARETSHLKVLPVNSRASPENNSLITHTLHSTLAISLHLLCTSAQTSLATSDVHMLTWGRQMRPSHLLR